MPKYLNTKEGSLESAVLEAVSRAQQAAIAIAKKEKEEVDESRVRDQKSYKAGQDAAKKGVKYDDNPNTKGSQAYLDWSKGHNSARAKKMGMREEKFAGWIAIFKGKKIEIRKDKDAHDLWSAKQFAIKALKVPKSQQGILAIEPAYEEVQKEENLDELAKFSDKEIKMAFGVINDPRWKGGNMTKIVSTIEKIKKGLSKHPSVEKAIKATNEELTAKQKKIDMNKDGKITGDDLAALRKKGAKKEEAFQESVAMTRYAEAITNMWKESAGKKVDKTEEKEDNSTVDGGKTMTGKPVSKVEVAPADKEEK